jgi:hypothetical protein
MARPSAVNAIIKRVLEGDSRAGRDVDQLQRDNNERIRLLVEILGVDPDQAWHALNTPDSEAQNAIAIPILPDLLKILRKETGARLSRVQIADLVAQMYSTRSAGVRPLHRLLVLMLNVDRHQSTVGRDFVMAAAIEGLVLHIGKTIGVEKVGRAVGVNHTMISRWRTLQDYIESRAYWQAVGTDGLDEGAWWHTAAPDDPRWPTDTAAVDDPD